jgi:protein SCO1/2
MNAEQHGIRTRAVIGAIAGLGVMIVLVCGAMYAVGAFWNAPLRGANGPMDVAIPGPKLQSAPQYDSTRVLSDKTRMLNEYAWVDRERGIARIPIEEAMKSIAGSAGPPEAVPRAPATSGEDPQPGSVPSRTPSVEQRTGAALPLDARLRDESGHDVPLSRYFGKIPAVLVFGYYRCPNLCTTFMESALIALSAAKADPRQYAIVAISVDPRETPRDAAEKLRLYKTAYRDVPLHLLTGQERAIARVARAAGVHYAYDAAIDQYAHPVALIVVSPQGRISRYFAGVQFEPRDLRLALVEASSGRVGSITDRVFLRCAHFDPQTGRYTVAAMTFVRGGCVLVGGGLAGFVWRRRRKKRWNR